MNTLLIGNTVSMIGCLIMVGIGLLKKKSHILIAQSFQCAFMGLGNLILGGVSGFTANVISILRNLVFGRYAVTVPLKLGFIAAQLLLSLSALGSGIISWIPVVANGIFTWFLDTKSEITLKLVIIATLVMWLVYDLCHHNYVSAAFDVMTMCSNCIGLYMIRKNP